MDMTNAITNALNPYPFFIAAIDFYFIDKVLLVQYTNVPRNS